MSAGQSAVAGDEVFSVGDIAVDETAATASQARAAAFRNGQRAALTTLLRRLTRRSDHSNLPQVDSERREFMVQALEVADERTSSVRYLATMTVSFKPAEVRRLLREAAIPFAETPSKPLLVLPVLRQGGAQVLWEEANPWRDAWSELPLNAGLVPLILPVGDLNDITDVDAAQAAEGDPLRLSAIARRYGAGDVLAAVATVSENAGVIRIDIAAQQIGAPSSGPMVFNFNISDPAVIPKILGESAAGVVASLEEAWKANNVIAFDRPGRMVVSVPLTSLEQWVSVERRLNDVASISEVSLISLTRGSASIEISHFGDEAQLAVTLAQQDLALELPAAPAFGSSSFGSGQVVQAPRIRILRPIPPRQ
ncbi:MAG: DUF2066 domain-containing protein [Alphaproteobacteria bacterium]|nr:DUF2066 domain-containing protein [Alphaproteobacteria bacterium]